MRRGDIVLTTAIAAIATLAGCGGGDSDPDAMLVPVADAPPQIDAPPACTLDMCPGNLCVDLDTDPMHCGACGNACQAGASCVSQNCECPPNFLPDTLTGNPLGFDMVISDLPGALIAVTAYTDGAINIFGVGYEATDPPLGTNLQLDGSTLPAPPFVLAGYDVDISTMMPRAAFAAISGTVRYTRACATGASGIVRNATFQAATLMPPQVDPNGCTFTVESVQFSIDDPSMCPAM